MRPVTPTATLIGILIGVTHSTWLRCHTGMVRARQVPILNLGLQIKMTAPPPCARTVKKRLRWLLGPGISRAMSSLLYPPTHPP